MTRHPFSPSTLDLLPGESQQPPLRLLQHPGPRQQARVRVVLPTSHWLARLGGAARRVLLG